ncbi:MAG: hypothetical protein GY809_18070, partial [Planctomycetes bacterium]|nr:hypothetical protein [Planctomycetota bacterium]
IMFGVSYVFPRKEIIEEQSLEVVDMHGWKYAYALSAVLVIATVTIYVLLGRV